jgi:hypothetical protein
VNLAYNYDILGRLTNVLANGSSIAHYGFDVLGNLQTMGYADGVTNLYQYDAMNRPTNLVWNLNNTALASFGYTLGATGNRQSLLEIVNGTLGPFRCVGGGDVPKGNKVYIFFYTDVP